MRAFRTGDIGWMGVDGVCRLVGRRDDQMKINGQRVEGGEVRHALLTSSEGVRDAEVVGVRVEGGGGGRGRDVLVAFVRVVGEGVGGKRRRVVVEGGEVRVREEGEERLKGDEIVWFQCLEVEERIRKNMREKVPAYMVPSTILLLSHFPITPNGKTSKILLKKLFLSTYASLPPPPPSTPSTSSTPSLPSSLLSQITLAYSHTLSLPPASILPSSNFFDLGGHSLLLIDLASRLEENTGHSVTIRELLPLKNVQSLVTLLSLEEKRKNDNQKGGSVARGMSRLAGSRGVSRDSGGVPRVFELHRRYLKKFFGKKDNNNNHVEIGYPLSRSQMRMWFLQELHPDSFAYNVPILFKISAQQQQQQQLPISGLNLQTALRTTLQVVAKHDILRTKYKEDQRKKEEGGRRRAGMGGPMQYVDDSVKFELWLVGGGEDGKEEGWEIEYEEEVRKFSEMPFCLKEGGFRMMLVVEGGGGEGKKGERICRVEVLGENSFRVLPSLGSTSSSSILSSLPSLLSSCLIGFNFHHIGFDSVSLSLFLRDWSSLYTSLSSPSQSFSSFLPVFMGRRGGEERQKYEQYVDYVLREKWEERREGAEKEKQRERWREKFLSLPHMAITDQTSLPYDHLNQQQQQQQQHQVFSHTHHITGPAFLHFQSLARSSPSSSSPLFTLSLSLTLLWLLKISKQESVVVGTPVTNREGM